MRTATVRSLHRRRCSPVRGTALRTLLNMLQQKYVRSLYVAVPTACRSRPSYVPSVGAGLFSKQYLAVCTSSLSIAKVSLQRSFCATRAASFVILCPACD